MGVRGKIFREGNPLLVAFQLIIRRDDANEQTIRYLSELKKELCQSVGQTTFDQQAQQIVSNPPALAQQLNDEMSGIGKQFKPDGRIFEGQFKLGKLNGIGTIKFENGSTYFGEFVNNNMHGAGEMKMSNGG